MKDDDEYEFDVEIVNERYDNDADYEYFIEKTIPSQEIEIDIQPVTIEPSYEKQTINRSNSYFFEIPVIFNLSIILFVFGIGILLYRSCYKKKQPKIKKLPTTQKIRKFLNYIEEISNDNLFNENFLKVCNKEFDLFLSALKDNSMILDSLVDINSHQHILDCFQNKLEKNLRYQKEELYDHSLDLLRKQAYLNFELAIRPVLVGIDLIKNCLDWMKTKEEFIFDEYRMKLIQAINARNIDDILLYDFLLQEHGITHDQTTEINTIITQYNEEQTQLIQNRYTMKLEQHVKDIMITLNMNQIQFLPNQQQIENSETTTLTISSISYDVILTNLPNLDIDPLYKIEITKIKNSNHGDMIEAIAQHYQNYNLQAKSLRDKATDLKRTRHENLQNLKVRIENSETQRNTFLSNEKHRIHQEISLIEEKINAHRLIYHWFNYFYFVILSILFSILFSSFSMQCYWDYNIYNFFKCTLFGSSSICRYVSFSHLIEKFNLSDLFAQQIQQSSTHFLPTGIYQLMTSKSLLTLSSRVLFDPFSFISKLLMQWVYVSVWGSWLDCGVGGLCRSMPGILISSIFRFIGFDSIGYYLSLLISIIFFEDTIVDILNGPMKPLCLILSFHIVSFIISSFVISHTYPEITSVTILSIVYLVIMILVISAST